MSGFRAKVNQPQPPPGVDGCTVYLLGVHFTWPTGTQDGLATTDVATGQPNQSADSYQGALGSAGGGMMTTAPPPSSYQYGGAAMGEPTTGYQPVREL